MRQNTIKLRTQHRCSRSGAGAVEILNVTAVMVLKQRQALTAGSGCGLVLGRRLGRGMGRRRRDVGFEAQGADVPVREPGLQTVYVELSRSVLVVVFEKERQSGKLVNQQRGISPIT